MHALSQVLAEFFGEEDQFDDAPIIPAVSPEVDTAPLDGGASGKGDKQGAGTVPKTSPTAGVAAPGVCQVGSVYVLVVCVWSCRESEACGAWYLLRFVLCACPWD